eukprot:312911_1
MANKSKQIMHKLFLFVRNHFYHINITLLLIFIIMNIVLYITAFISSNLGVPSIGEFTFSVNINMNDALIPYKIYVTHQYNLCDHKVESHTQTKRSKQLSLYYRLLSNVQKMKEYNIDFDVICFDDRMAYKYLKSKNITFAKYFLNEKMGMYKS